jgi:hypothetical protein
LRSWQFLTDPVKQVIRQDTAQEGLSDYKTNPMRSQIQEACGFWCESPSSPGRIITWAIPTTENVLSSVTADGE